MKKTEMRDDYGDVLKDGVRGKYYERALRAKGLARIDPDLLVLFPDSDAVNKALRSVAKGKKTPA